MGLAGPVPAGRMSSRPARMWLLLSHDIQNIARHLSEADRPEPLALAAQAQVEARRWGGQISLSLSAVGTSNSIISASGFGGGSVSVNHNAAGTPSTTNILMKMRANWHASLNVGST